MSINKAKWTLFLFLCASRITSFLLLAFSSCHAGIVSSFFLVNQVVMGHRSETFACIAIFMFCEWRRFLSLPCGFMRFHHTTINRFGNLLGCNFLLRSHLRGACPSFLFRTAWLLPLVIPIFSSHVSEFLCILGHQDR